MGNALNTKALWKDSLPHSVATLLWNIITETCLIWTFPVPEGGFVNYL